MNILTSPLPSSVDIDGKNVPINTDYRDCLRSIMAFEDNDLTAYEKTLVMLANLYPTPPPDTRAAIERAGWFLNCGKDSEASDGPRVYSFAKDAERIFAAFHQVHGIDLQETDLHWWKFVALFQAVIADQDNAFGSLVILRLRVKTGKASKEEQHAAMQMGDDFYIPDIDDRTLEEKEIEARYMAAIEQVTRT